MHSNENIPSSKIAQNCTIFTMQRKPSKRTYLTVFVLSINSGTMPLNYKIISLLRMATKLAIIAANTPKFIT